MGLNETGKLLEYIVFPLGRHVAKKQDDLGMNRSHGELQLGCVQIPLLAADTKRTAARQVYFASRDGVITDG